jgi:hypothetical protein
METMLQLEPDDKATPTAAEWITAELLTSLATAADIDPAKVAGLIAQYLARQRAKYEAVADELDKQAPWPTPGDDLRRCL